MRGTSMACGITWTKCAKTEPPPQKRMNGTSRHMFFFHLAQEGSSCSEKSAAELRGYDPWTLSCMERSPSFWFPFCSLDHVRPKLVRAAGYLGLTAFVDMQMLQPTKLCRDSVRRLPLLMRCGITVATSSRI